MRRSLVILLLLVLLGGYGVLALVRSASPPGEAEPGQAGQATERLVFYTTHGATTPQIPFWAAVRQGWPQGMALETRTWKDLDDLRGVVLAGKGDIWLGHIEGFAQAALRGAPARLLAVTGWRKFYFLTDDPAVRDLTGLAAAVIRDEAPLAVTPPDSPALGLLENIARHQGPIFRLTRHAPRQLALEVLRGQVHHVLAPEPLVSMLLLKAPRLRVVAGLEAAHAQYCGGPDVQPIAGLAVHADLLQRRPELVRDLLGRMQAAAETLVDQPSEALAMLPPEVAGELGPEVLANSMSRDLLRVTPAPQARRAVLDFLALVMPQGPGPGRAALPEAFWARP
ncbi:MAG: hypothetical protein V1797_18105 [Pseudomonadota bacterium]